MVKRRSSEVLPVCGNSGRVSTSRRAARCKEPPHGLVGLDLPAAEQSIYNIIYIYNIYSYTYTWNFLGPPMAWALGRHSGHLGSEPGLLKARPRGAHRATGRWRRASGHLWPARLVVPRSVQWEPNDSILWGLLFKPYDRLKLTRLAICIDIATLWA